MAAVNEGFIEENGDGVNCSQRRKVAKSDNGKVGSEAVDIHLDNMIDTKEGYSEKDEILLEETSKNFLSVGISRFWACLYDFQSSHRKFMKTCLLLASLILIAVYIAAVIRQFVYTDNYSQIDWCRGYGMIFIVWAIIAWMVVYYILLVPYVIPNFVCSSRSQRLDRILRRAQTVVMVILIVLIAAFLIWDTTGDRQRLISIAGLLTFIAAGFIFSKHPTRVKWRTVVVGLLIQFAMGMLAIRWSGGRQVFKCVGNLAEEFLEYSYAGATMVYGDTLVNKEKVFAFQALSAIFFVSMIVQVLFYFGWMQVFCVKLGWFIQVAMGTTVMESVNAVSSVFLGMTEAPLLYKPYIKDLTLSEMHAVMAGGFSTVSGTVFAAYTSFGVNPAHVITASMMTAPAALCYSKLVYPESTQTKTDAKNITFYKSEDKSVMDAVIQGAFVGINMILGIISTIIACVSLVAFLNDFLAWLGILAGIENFTLETILAYLLYPVVWIMGVQAEQCLVVSRLVGVKIVLNEFIAYQRLGEILNTGVLSPRTEAIATYALCSFANPASMGILISNLTLLCPEQRFSILKVVFRAFLSAVVISFLTACIAGALMPEGGFSD